MAGGDKRGNSILEWDTSTCKKERQVDLESKPTMSGCSGCFLQYHDGDAIWDVLPVKRSKKPPFQQLRQKNPLLHFKRDKGRNGKGRATRGQLG